MSSGNCNDDPFADLIAEMLNNETTDRSETDKPPFETIKTMQNGSGAISKKTELIAKHKLDNSHFKKSQNLDTTRTKSFSKLLAIYEENKETLFLKGFLPNGNSNIYVSGEDLNWLKSLENEKKEIDRKIKIILKNINTEGDQKCAENTNLNRENRASFEDSLMSANVSCPTTQKDNGIASRATQLISRKVLSPSQSSYVLKTMAAMWKDEVTIRSAWDTLKSIAAQALPPNKEKPKRASIKSFISLANISDVQSEAKKELKQGQKRIYEREACDYSSKADGESENCIIDEAKVSSGKSLGGEQESYYSYTDSSQSIEDGERDGDDRWRLIGRKEVGKLADMCSEEEAKLVIYDGEEEAEPGNELKLAASQAYKLRPASPQLTPKLVNQDSKAREASGESAPRMRVDVPAFERMLTHHLGRRRASDPPAPRPTNSDEPASPVPENKVKCRRCTFLFPADKAQCGVCWAPADYREPEFWACDKCGYKKNEAVFDSCDVCGN